MRSSYIQNNYGEVFKNTVVAFKMGRLVEIGVLDGYSTVYIAMGLRELELLGYQGMHLDAYDLWDKYPYAHGNKDEVQKVLNDNGLAKYVTLYDMDAFEVHKEYSDRSVDMLHVDISNDGDIFDKMVELWHSKLRFQSVFFFEGGSEERDKVDWMIKYGKRSIKPAMEGNKTINNKYIWGTYLAYPSLSAFIKKVE